MCLDCAYLVQPFPIPVGKGLEVLLNHCADIVFNVLSTGVVLFVDGGVILAAPEFHTVGTRGQYRQYLRK